MDITRFDALSRQFGAISTRRSALRTFAAAGLGLGLARGGIETSLAKKGKKKKKLLARCKKSNQCAGGLKCQKSNSQNSCFDQTQKRCCKPIGAKCDDGCECCGIDVICNGGFCQGA